MLFAFRGIRMFQVMLALIALACGVGATVAPNCFQKLLSGPPSSCQLHRRIGAELLVYDLGASASADDPRFFAAGADVITLGDHVWDKSDIYHI